MTMFNRILALFDSDPGASQGVSRVDEVQLSAAALLVEVALLDQDFGPEEHARVAAILSERFGLNEEETQSLLAEAERRVEGSSQLLPFTRVIKDRFSPEERIEMVEMLWEVVYADGVLHDHEAMLMRRIGGLVYVSDHDRGEARKRALAKLKKSGD